MVVFIYLLIFILFFDWLEVFWIDLYNRYLLQVNHTWRSFRKLIMKVREIRSMRCWDWSPWKMSLRRSSNQKSWTSLTSTVSGPCLMNVFLVLLCRQHYSYFLEINSHSICTSQNVYFLLMFCIVNNFMYACEMTDMHSAFLERSTNHHVHDVRVFMVPIFF